MLLIELNRRDGDLVDRGRERRPEIGPVGSLPKPFVGDDANRSIRSGTVDADDLPAVGGDDAEVIVVGFCRKLRGKAIGDAPPPHRFGRAVLRVDASRQA